MKNYLISKQEQLTGLAIWLSTFIVYLLTLAPTVGFIDSGELAAVACTLGIAHPTGYPLFTVLGRVFSLLPIASEEIVRLNIMSALFTSLAALAFFFLMLELLEKTKNETTKNTNITSAAFAALALAFSQTFWKQGVSAEVYSLHLLLIITTTLFFVKAMNDDRSIWWFLFAFILGLSFTNHLTTVLLAPAFLFLFFAEHKFGPPTFTKIGKLSIPFFAGLSAYLYLPIRASQSPLLNWGNPQTFEKFWWHVTGKQFRVWMFASGDAARKQFDYFWERIPIEFFYVPLLFALVGFFVLLFSDRRKLIFISLLLITCVAYSINYDIHDIDSYFLLAFAALMIFAGFGASKIFASVNILNKRIAAASLVIVLIGVQVNQNWREVDQSGNYLVEDHTKNILNNLPRNSIIISYQWDYFVSASYYFQFIKKHRPDIIVLDKELFRRSWYFPQLEKMYPELMKKSRVESELFLQELFKFEHDLPYDYTAIEGRYTSLMKSFIDNNVDSVSCFVTPEIEQTYTAGYNRVPYGFALMLTKDTSYIETQLPTIEFRNFVGSDKYAQQIKKFSASALLQRSMYEHLYGRDSLSELYRRKMFQFDFDKDPSVIKF